MGQIGGKVFIYIVLFILIVVPIGLFFSFYLKINKRKKMLNPNYYTDNIPYNFDRDEIMNKLKQRTLNHDEAVYLLNSLWVSGEDAEYCLKLVWGK